MLFIPTRFVSPCVKHVVRATGSRIRSITSIQSRSLPATIRIPCRFCPKILLAAQGRALHKNAVHGAAYWNQGAPVRRQLRKSGSSILPWNGRGHGRCLGVAFGSLSGGKCFRPSFQQRCNPRSEAQDFRKAQPTTWVPTIFCESKKKQKAGGAAVRRRCTFREMLT